MRDLSQGYKHTLEQVEAELDWQDTLQDLPQNVIDDVAMSEHVVLAAGVRAHI